MKVFLEHTAQVLELLHQVQGTVLVHRKLRFQAFPGKTGPPVSGFTVAAKTLER